MKSKWILTAALAAALCTAVPGMAQAPAGKTTGQTTSSSAKTATSAPTDKDIADAKSKGMVWVNTSTKVYHKDGEFYGKTKKGKFMTEDDATKGGFKAAKEPGSKTATPAAKK
jgi:hypothetical protein